jgi:hypothetical protein
VNLFASAISIALGRMDDAETAISCQQLARISQPRLLAARLLSSRTERMGSNIREIGVLIGGIVLFSDPFVAQIND